MAPNNKLDDDLGQEKTTRWVEHQLHQQSVKRWKIAFVAMFPLLALILWFFFGR